MPQIEVTFDIDADGILKVSATDKATSRSQQITIHASSGLNDDEIERMRREAEQNAEQDIRRREFVEARNAADNAVYSADKRLGELGDSAPQDLKSDTQAKVVAAKNAIQTEDVAKIKDATRALLEAVKALPIEGSQADAAGSAAPGETGDPSEGKDVVDGEFKQV